MKKIVLALAMFVATAAQADVSLIPAHPTANRTFSIGTSFGECRADLNARAAVSGSVITVSYDAAAVTLDPCPLRRIAPTISVPAGTYEVRLVPVIDGVARQATVLLPALVIGANDFTGLWYDPAAPGRGLHVVKGESGTLFATFFTYTAGANIAPPGRAQSAWYYASGGQFISPTEFSGAMYLARSGSNVTSVGTMTLRLVADGQLRLQVAGAQFDGTAIDLRRLEY